MNIRLVRTLGLTLPILLAVGCDKPPPRALFTVNYYRTHENIRHEKVRECQTNTELSNTPDCINATKAEAQGTLPP